MKRISTLFLAFLCTHAIGQQVHFTADGIVYSITSSTAQTVQVEPYYTLLDNPYSGNVTIAQTVEYEGVTYTVTSLAESAFENCTGVTSLSLPSTVRSLGDYCFYNCNFTTLQLPDSLRSLGDMAFLYSHVEALHLPSCFETYGNGAFWARNLTSITVDEDNPFYRSIDGWLYSKDSLTLCIVPDGTSGTITVPSFVKHLGRHAIGFNSLVTSVLLPEGLTSIGDFAFNICKLVNNIVIPSTVTHVGLCPFSYCPQLTNLSVADGNTHYVMDGLLLYSAGYDTLISCHKSGPTVTLNDNVRVLGGFENNTWAQNITIPDGVTEISDNCFNGCSFSSIVLPAHMSRIGAHAFAENSKLVNVSLPKTLLSMGEGAFSWCEKLNSIRIPDSLHIIPKEAFNSCPRLAFITWGNAVEEIGYAAFWAMAVDHLNLPPTLRKLDDFAFAACANDLRTVTLHSQLDTMGEAVFRHANLDHICFTVGNPPVVTGEGPLHDIGRLDSIIVPCGSLNAWLADSYWGQFADKYREKCSSIDDVHSSGIKIHSLRGQITVEGADGEAIQIFDITGRTIPNEGLSTGVYFVRVGHRPARKVFVKR